jgi:6-phosphogluconolactonase
MEYAIVYLRSYFALVSNSVDGDIAVFHLDGSTGRMTLVERCPTGEVTMPMALTADEQFVYAVTRGSVPELKKFSIDSQSGHLTHFKSAGINASLAYLSIDRAGRYLFGASYGEHLLNVYCVDRIDASEGTPLQSISGIEHAHAAIVSTDDRFVYATSLGGDMVVCLEIRSDNPGAPLVPFDQVALDKGFGPRHLRFSPSGEFLYVLSEFRATVAVFRRDRQSGRLSLQSVSPRAAPLSNLDDGWARPSLSNPVQPDPKTLLSLVWAADIQIRPDGRFVYVSERTSSRLLIFEVAADGASLEYAGCISTEAQPRGFKIDPTGTFLVACGEKSSQLSVYGIDADSGELSLLSRCEGGRGANWIEIVEAREITKPAAALQARRDSKN